MKTLYESILDDISTKDDGLKIAIREWCDNQIEIQKKTQQRNGLWGRSYKNKFEYKLNSKNELTFPNHSATVNMTGISELPEFIKIADDESLTLHIVIDQYNSTDIKSFRGFPKTVNTFAINRTGKSCVLKDLDIKAKDKVSIRGDFSGYENVNIEFVGSGQRHFRLDTKSPLKGIRVKGCKIIEFVNDFNLGDLFSKLMFNKAKQNQYKHKFEQPISPEGEEIVKTFFDGTVDISTLMCVQYTQNSQLLRKDPGGPWYRFKNWN